jgi:hypothetical protein
MTKAAEADAGCSKTCPSGPAETGSVVLGVIAARGHVAYISPNIPVTSRLLDNFSQHGVLAENRIRFASRCIKHECIQWKEQDNAQAGRCGLIDHAIGSLKVEAGPDTLPDCGIRGTCRWFAQHAVKACTVCPEIIRRSAAQCGAASLEADTRSAG